MDRMSDLFRSAHRGKKEIGARLCNRKLGLTDEPKSSLLRQCLGWAEVKVGDEHLRLFSEHSTPGVQASVYKRRCKERGCSSEIVNDIEQGKSLSILHDVVIGGRGTPRLLL
jgi:hypothetical protein